MEMLQLHYFQVVAKFEHMTKAAEMLRIAQPAFRTIVTSRWRLKLSATTSRRISQIKMQKAED